jgi:general secretion pathway protein D
VADERSNSLIITGDEQSRERVIKLVHSLDTEIKHNSNNIRVFYLQYATASEVVSVLQGISGSIQSSQGTQSSSGSKGKTSSKKTSSSQSDLSIESHVGTNSIIISAQPEMMSSLSSIIHQLDIRRAQVLVEAIIVEISEDDGVGLNSQFASTYGGTSFSDNGASTADILASYITASEDDDYDDAISTLSEVSGSIFGFGDDDWAFIIQAVSTSSTANILSTPSITTLDNEEASFIVGDEVPVITGSSSSSGSDTFSTVEREEVGIKLKVTPQINKGDTIKMVIEQEVSSIQGATTVDIIFATRSVKTTVLANQGQRLFLVV